MEADFLKILLGIAAIVASCIALYMFFIYIIDEYQSAKADLENLKTRLHIIESKFLDEFK